MELFFLDSADPTEVQRAADSGLVTGVTTNPTILHSAAPDTDPLEHIAYLFDLFPGGPVFHQLHTRDRHSAEAQATRLLNMLGEHADRIVFKLPAQPNWFVFGADLVRDSHRVAYTAVYQPGQMLAAAQAGATYVIPYVDRARRLRPEAPDVVSELSSVAVPGGPRILAASVKSAAQAVGAFRNGAQGVTVPWQILEALMSDTLTDSAIDAFHTAVPA